ncbi:hypothetical protein HAX54_011954 [Datura stramonium]|uniref:Uncharacterized protein n=1 Tax=Datura stramonium TaxID=4076 RepID=A0ABS8Y285_DATST|nr:hypothetical protein [Datura stramonium]
MSGLFTERCFLYNLLTSDVNAEIANVDEQVDGGSDIEHVGLQNIQAHVQMVLAFISADIDPIESIKIEAAPPTGEVGPIRSNYTQTQDDCTNAFISCRGTSLLCCTDDGSFTTLVIHPRTTGLICSSFCTMSAVLINFGGLINL